MLDGATTTYIKHHRCSHKHKARETKGVFLFNWSKKDRPILQFCRSELLSLIFISFFVFHRLRRHQYTFCKKGNGTTTFLYTTTRKLFSSRKRQRKREIYLDYAFSVLHNDSVQKNDEGRFVRKLVGSVLHVHWFHNP